MITRRQFLQGSASLALISLLPRGGMGTTSLRTRPSWSSFRTSSLYPAFLAGVRKMQANLDSTQPGSWAYWVNVHATHCPHKLPYFLAWHRGFLMRFEAQLRTASGNGALVLPYWDYFRDPVLPAEFTDPASPLYRSNRVHTDVTGALSLSAFSSSVTNFQRGTTNAFEPAIETLPHNGVHNLIGGSMSAVTVSPRDPIFWLHHANIDRLWDAWAYAGGGRRMPATTSTYWAGWFSYGAAVPGIKRVSTYSPSNLGYRYDNRTLPSILPSTLQAAVAAMPAMQDIVAASIPAQGLSLGGLAGVALGQRSARARLPLTPEGRNRVRSLLTRREQTTSVSSESVRSDPLRIVLDGVAPTDAGAQGGYFYKILLNLPSRGIAQPEPAYLIGTLGPFEIAAAIHAQGMANGGHMAMPATAQIVLPATDVLRRIWPDSLDALTLSFVRVDAGAPRQGTAITIDRMWVEAEN